jgi:hypothetical protein
VVYVYKWTSGIDTLPWQMTWAGVCINRGGITLTLHNLHTHGHTKLNIMDQKHRDILIRNRLHLSRELKAAPLAQYLYEAGIFTRLHVEDISYCKGPTRQAYAFLDMLPCRGPEAFDLFLQGLEATGQHDITPIVTDTPAVSTIHIYHTPEYFMYRMPSTTNQFNSPV